MPYSILFVIMDVRDRAQNVGQSEVLGVIASDPAIHLVKSRPVSSSEFRRQHSFEN